jgi:hypothetical protein
MLNSMGRIQLFYFASLLLLLVGSANAQIYLAKTCEISFFSANSMGDITAVNKTSKPIMDISTGDVQVKISIQGFVFPDPLMQEHFNENYLESDKYPDATFKGKINEPVDYTRDGVTKVTVKGNLEMHGVKKDINFDGTITVKGVEVILETRFKIHIADFHIKIPSLVVKNIAEDIDVKMKGTLDPFTPPAKK